jgi:hypothetical protein
LPEIDASIQLAVVADRAQKIKIFEETSWIYASDRRPGSWS